MKKYNNTKVTADKNGNVTVTLHGKEIIYRTQNKTKQN